MSEILLIVEFEFIGKQPMKAGQGLKSSLATQKHRKKMTHIHTNETVKTENEFILKRVYFWTKINTFV